MRNNFNIVQSLSETALTHPGALVISAGKDEITYGDFTAGVKRLAGFLKPVLKTGRIGILGTRSIAAYEGIAAAAWAGGTYVPLNLKWPEERLVELLAGLDLDALVVDKNGATLLTDAVMSAAPSLIFRSEDAPHIAGTVAFGDFDISPMQEPASVGPDHTAYIIFTSGTTGMPKGVVVSCGSLAEYLGQTRKWTKLNADDRIAEAHDVTFDLSVHNMFLAWEAGASLHLMSSLDMMAPQRFIRAREISCWMSVPTIVTMMRKSGALKTGLFPSLRLSVFCGEPLPVTAVQDWAQAAPNSMIENIYGPTECTVVCTRQRLTDPPVVTEKRQILAIGEPYENFRIALFDANQNEVPKGETGEIALCSPQLSDGYFNAPEQTADRFRTINGERWYLTGDLGMRDENGILHHMGRADNQVKVKGNRIELEEVEMHLRRAALTDAATVVAWPVTDGSVEGLVAFYTNPDRGVDDIQREMLLTLPRYMVPQRIEFRTELPVNVNGKTDRKALFAELESDCGQKVDAPASTTPKREKVDAG